MGIDRIEEVFKWFKEMFDMRGDLVETRAVLDKIIDLEESYQHMKRGYVGQDYELQNFTNDYLNAFKSQYVTFNIPPVGSGPSGIFTLGNIGTAGQQVNQNLHNVFIGSATGAEPF